MWDKSAPRRSRDDFETLRRVGQVINSSLEISRVLDDVMDLVIQEMHAERGFIMLMDSESGELEFAAARNFQHETLHSEQFQVSRSILEQVRVSHQPVLSTDALQDQRFDGSMSVQMLGLRSVLCVPLLYKLGFTGIIYVDNRAQSGVFYEADRELLLAIADQAAIAIENARLYRALQQSFLDLVKALSNAIEERESYTRGHSEMVAHFSVLIARALQLSTQQIQEVRLSGLLHDVGKIGIKDHILLKPGGLSQQEREEMDRHADIGHRIVEHVNWPEIVRLSILHHQERFDGKGYPDGLAGEAIPLPARIVAVADAYHAMVSDRIYRKALPADLALAELQKGAGSQFDPQVVNAFLELVAAGKVQVCREDSSVRI